MGGRPGGPRGQRRRGGDLASRAVPGWSHLHSPEVSLSGPPALAAMEERSRARVPPHPAHRAPTGKQPWSPNRSLRAGRPSLPDNSVAGVSHGSRSIFGYHAPPEGGLAPDKGCHSACLRAEPTTQGLLGAGQGLGEVRRPGNGETWAGDRATVTIKTHLPGSGRLVRRGRAFAG